MTGSAGPKRSVEVDGDWLFDLSEATSLSDLQAWVQSVIDAVPEAFRADTKLDIYMGEGPTMRVYYYRPETEADRAEDEARKAELAERERREYERLKVKFEGKS